MRAKTYRGQSALEYILLVGAAVLVAMIALLILAMYGPIGEQILNENIEDYQKIDLCTGEGAGCSVFMDWTAGFTSGGLGFVLTNTSDWRTLIIDGVTLRLLCDNGPCDPDGLDFFPTINLELPVQPSGGNPHPTLLCNSTDGIHCDFCDVDTEVCQSVPGIPFCVGSVCEVTYGPGGTFPFPVEMTLSSGESEKTGFTIFEFLQPGATALQISFHARQEETGPLAAPPSFDPDAQPASYYTSWPSKTGTTYQCQNLTTGGVVDYGCAYEFGCTITACGISTLQSVVDFCTEGDYPDGYGLCIQGDGKVTDDPSKFSCTPIPPDGDAHVLTQTTGGLITIDPSLMNGVTFMEVPTNGLVLSASDFSTLSSCTTPSSCDSACNALFGSAFGLVELYSFPLPPAKTLACSAFANEIAGGSPIVLDSPTPVVRGTWNGTERYCWGIYGITDFLDSQQPLPGSMTLGYRYRAPLGSIEVDSIFGIRPPLTQMVYFPG